jgi:hypothetical protein
MTLPSNPSDTLRRLNPHIYREQPLIKSDAFVRDPLQAKRRIRQSAKPLLNELEAAWFDVLKRTNPSARPQALTFRLGNGIAYKPDFVDLTVRPVTCWEVKGPHAFRGGLENLKVAAALYPELRWVLVWQDGVAWKTQEVLP